MAYDLEEQEQLDAFKTWWKANGNMVITAVGVAVVSFLAVQGWKYYQHKQAIQASAQYQTLIQTDAKEIKTVRAISAELMDKYASTPYAGRAAVYAAKVNYAAKDAQSAKAQLAWAEKNAQEDSVKAIAQLQLAAIQLDDKNYDEALKTLAEKHETGFDGLFADLKGDVLTAQGKHADAKLAYQEALAKLDARGRYFHFVQHKLEALGS